MLVYIIDGFNLVYKVPSLKNSSTPQYDLIQYIRANRLTGSVNNKVIIVFDGWPNLKALQAKDRLEIIFSGKETADTVITKRLQKIKNRSEVIVVSDDRQIQETIKKMRARVCRISDFIKPKEKKERSQKEISYTLQQEITQELRKIWLGE